jgi:hypothetical protein
MNLEGFAVFGIVKDRYEFNQPIHLAFFQKFTLAVSSAAEVLFIYLYS